jgi:hypothetical protein
MSSSSSSETRFSQTPLALSHVSNRIFAAAMYELASWLEGQSNSVRTLPVSRRIGTDRKLDFLLEIKN